MTTCKHVCLMHAVCVQVCVKSLTGPDDLVTNVDTNPLKTFHCTCLFPHFNCSTAAWSGSEGSRTTPTTKNNALGAKVIIRSFPVIEKASGEKKKKKKKRKKRNTTKEKKRKNFYRFTRHLRPSSNNPIPANEKKEKKKKKETKKKGNGFISLFIFRIDTGTSQMHAIVFACSIPIKPATVLHAQH